MHLRHTLRTPAACGNTRNNRGLLSILSCKQEWHCAKSTSKSKVTEGDKFPSLLKSPPAVVVPPPVKKEEANIWVNIPGADKLIHITDTNFDEIVKAQKSLLVIFYGSWCSVCKEVKTEIGKAAAQLGPKEGALGVCDVMENHGLADRYLVRQTPALKYFRNGVHAGDYLGKPLTSEIITFMKNPSKRFV